VQAAEGEDLAKANRAAWLETSAKNNINVGELPFYSYVKPLPGIN
jgi:Ras family protein